MHNSMICTKFLELYQNNHNSVLERFYHLLNFPQACFLKVETEVIVLKLTFF